MNGCLNVFLGMLPVSLYNSNHGAGTWNDSVRDGVDEKIVFIDMQPFVARNKDNVDGNDGEFKTFEKDTLHTEDQSGFIAAVSLALHAHHQILCGNEKLSVMCATAEGHRVLLGGADPFEDDGINFRGGVPHGNNWIVPRNLRSHWERYDQINQILAAAFSVCFTATTIAPLCQKYANDGAELTPEEREQRRRATHDRNVKGGKTSGNNH